MCVNVFIKHTYRLKTNNNHVLTTALRNITDTFKTPPWWSHPCFLSPLVVTTSFNNVLLFLFIYLLHRLWDFNSLSRDQTRSPSNESSRPPGNSPEFYVECFLAFPYGFATYIYILKQFVSSGMFLLLALLCTRFDLPSLAALAAGTGIRRTLPSCSWWMLGRFPVVCRYSHYYCDILVAVCRGTRWKVSLSYVPGSGITGSRGGHYLFRFMT